VFRILIRVISGFNRVSGSGNADSVDPEMLIQSFHNEYLRIRNPGSHYNIFPQQLVSPRIVVYKKTPLWPYGNTCFRLLAQIFTGFQIKIKRVPGTVPR
jgi:hypothetical protein